MAVWMGVDVVATVDSGLTGLKIHAARVEWQQQEFDVTGSSDTNNQVAFGDRKIRVRLDCSHAGSTPAFVFPGNTCKLTFEIDSTGTANYQEDFAVQSIGWDWDKRGGGPPQRFPVILTPHGEGLTNETNTAGFFATNTN